MYRAIIEIYLQSKSLVKGLEIFGKYKGKNPK